MYSQDASRGAESGAASEISASSGVTAVQNAPHASMSWRSLSSNTPRRYPAGSLRERVYAGAGGHGILTYTGSSDSEGTLGGQIEAGRRFAGHLEH